jgi:hypothetical protein
VVIVPRFVSLYAQDLLRIINFSAAVYENLLSIHVSILFRSFVAITEMSTIFQSDLVGGFLYLFNHIYLVEKNAEGKTKI